MARALWENARTAGPQASPRTRASEKEGPALIDCQQLRVRPAGLSRAGASAALAALAAALALALAGPSAGQAAEVPPELVSLEQQMAKLQVNSERFTLQEEISVGEIGGSAIPFALLISGRGEVSDTPAEASVEAGLLGATFARERVIGETEWVYESRAKEVDGGRPWVRRERRPPQASGGLGLGLLEAPEAGSQGTFGKLIEELNGAQTLIDSGPVTVENERVIEFDASVNPAPLIARLEAEAKASEPPHPLQSLFPGLPGSGPKGPTRTSPADARARSVHRPQRAAGARARHLHLPRRRHLGAL